MGITASQTNKTGKKELLTHVADNGEFQRLFKFGVRLINETDHERVYLAVAVHEEEQQARDFRRLMDSNTLPPGWHQR